ncbi:MAG: hypothetical protein AAFU41_08320 [Pseudomonadota bacterium]
MKLFTRMDSLPTDSAVTRLLTNIRDIFLLYFSFIYVIAPFEIWTAIVLLIAVPISIFIWWRYKARFWLSGLILIIVILSIQTLMLFSPNRLTYYVECDDFVLSCFHTRRESALGEDVRMMPFNSPLTGAKRLLTRAFVGEESFDDRFIQSTIVGGEPRLQSPLEYSLFDYLGGNSVLGGVQIPYRLNPEYRTMSISTGVSFRSNGDRFFTVASRASTNLLPPSRQRRIFQNSQSSEKDLSFFADGDPTSLDTWLRAVRNDLWLQRLALTPTTELIKQIESDGTPLSPNEFLMLEGMKLFVRCRSPETPERLIGCRSRLSELIAARDELPGDRNWTGSVVDPMLNAVAQGTSLHIDQEYLIEIGYFEPTSLDEPLLAVGASDTGLPIPEPITAEQLTSLAGPTDKAVARAGLETILLESFTNTLPSRGRSNSECIGQQVELFYGALARLSSSNAAETYSQLANCIDDQRAGLHEYMLQNDKAFEEALISTLSGMNSFERREFTSEAVMDVDDFQRQLTDIHLMETLGAVSQVFSTGGQEVLYSQGLFELVATLRTRYLEAVLLENRRSLLLQQFSDAPMRVEAFLSQSYIGHNSKADFWRKSLVLLDQFLGALQSLKANHPEPSRVLSTDLKRLLQDPNLNQEAISSLIDELGFRVPSEFTADIQLLASLDSCFVSLVDAVLEAAFTDVTTVLFDEVETALRFMEGVSDNCYEIAQLFALISDQGSNLQDPQTISRFQANYPELVDYLVLNVEELALADLGDDWSSALTAFVVEEIGNAALGLQLVDWEAMRRNRPISDATGASSYWSEEYISDAKDTLCRVWGDIRQIERETVDRRKLWENSGLLISLARIQSLCDPNSRSILRTTLLEIYGAEILDGVDQFRVTPLQRSLLEYEVPPSIAVIPDSPSTQSQRSAAASFGLLRYGSQKDFFANEEDEVEGEDSQLVSLVILPLTLPARSDIPVALVAGQAYLDAAEELLTHPDLAVRQVVLDFFIGDVIEAAGVLDVIAGSGPTLDSKEVASLVAFLEVLRATLPEDAGSLAMTLKELDLSSLQRVAVVDALFDDNELEEAASQILLIPAAEIPFSKLSQWTLALLTDEGRLKLNRPVLLRALVHMRS